MRRGAIAAGAAGICALALAGVANASTSPFDELVPPVLTPLPPVLEPPPTTPLPDPPDIGARVEARTFLRVRPNGPAVARIGRRTEFGSPRILPVVKQRGGWVGVIASQQPNGQLGWIPATKVRLVREPVRLRIDLSARRLTVVRNDHVLWSMRIGVGSPGTPTPTGTYAVTDGLLWRGSRVYGCCVLALSAHQPHLAQGWTGGDRIAVHGTNAPGTIGAAESLGCLHAFDRDMRRLMRYATLGARVNITA
jgi:lipoprotein-anchoring transpeptidase ErfK/SrfK